MQLLHRGAQDKGDMIYRVVLSKQVLHVRRKAKNWQVLQRRSCLIE
jgi:hypothetical protein